MKINKGKLWLNDEWEYAINETFKIMKDNKIRGNTCGFVRIEEIWKDKFPDKLLSTEKVFDGYRFICDDRKTYKTKIPRKYDIFIKNILKGIKQKVLK